MFHMSLLEKYILDIVSGRQQLIFYFMDIPKLKQWDIKAILS